jgi:hypothetical protein
MTEFGKAISYEIEYSFEHGSGYGS